MNNFMKYANSNLDTIAQKQQYTLRYKRSKPLYLWWSRLEDIAKMKIAELRRELKKQKRVPKRFRDLNLINKLSWSIEKIVSLSKLYSAGGQLEEFRSYLGARND